MPRAKVTVRALDGVMTDEEIQGLVTATCQNMLAHNLTPEVVLRCLPLIGELRDYGQNPDAILAFAIGQVKDGRRPGGGG